MKVEVKSKKGLKTILSVIVDKKSIQTKLEEKLGELQKEVSLKGKVNKVKLKLNLKMEEKLKSKKEK